MAAMLTPEEEDALVAEIEDLLIDYPQDKVYRNDYAPRDMDEPKRYAPFSLGGRARWRGL
jgi:hypothetical protein